MRVLHVTPCYPPTWAYGGIPRVVYALARAQVKIGLDVRVWTTDAFDAARRSGMPSTRIDHGVEVIVSRLVSNRLAWEQQLYLPVGSAPIADVDVVHLHGHRNLLNYRAFRQAHNLGIPVVQTPNGTAPRIERHQWAKWAWDLAFDGDIPRRAERVVAVSKAEIRQLLGVGVPADRIFRIPNPLHVEEFDDLPARGTFRTRYGIAGPLVAYLGQITPRKGVQHLVQAFANGALGATTLVVAGAPRGIELPNAPGVVYTGTLEGPDRLSLLVDADVLVYPSSDEVFGLVPMEGLLCGAPVIVGGDCGCGELIAEAGAGLLTTHGDVAELRRHIAELIENRAAAERMVERGRAYVSEHLDPARVAELYRNVYQDVLRES